MTFPTPSPFPSTALAPLGSAVLALGHVVLQCLGEAPQPAALLASLAQKLREELRAALQGLQLQVLRQLLGFQQALGFSTSSKFKPKLGILNGFAWMVGKGVAYF